MVRPMPYPVSPDAGVPEHQPDQRRQNSPWTGGQPPSGPFAASRPPSGQFACPPRFGSGAGARLARHGPRADRQRRQRRPSQEERQAGLDLVGRRVPRRRGRHRRRRLLLLRPRRHARSPPRPGRSTRVPDRTRRRRARTRPRRRPTVRCPATTRERPSRSSTSRTPCRWASCTARRARTSSSRRTAMPAGRPRRSAPATCPTTTPGTRGWVAGSS